ncbi:glycosyltransferase, partial [Bacteroidota bacterium]
MVSVSIVIPCRNEAGYIGKCLDSIIKNNYPVEWVEIFVCDGLSTDDSLHVIKDYTSKYANIHLLENKRLTTPYALNLGVKQSKSEVIIILSAHSEIDPDYISNCVLELENDKSLGCVGGVINNIYENKMGLLIGQAMSSSFGVGNAYFRTGGKEGYV